MKILLLTLVALGLGLLWLACKSPKHSPENLPLNQLRWGNGGGFVGKESAHILLENGQLFSRDIMGKTSDAGKTKKKEALALFNTAKSLGLAAMEFEHPGNTYSFLEWQEGDMVSRVVWGDRGHPVPKGVEELYGALNGLLKQ